MNNSFGVALRVFLALVILCCAGNILSAKALKDRPDKKKELQASRNDTHIRIDGNLDEAAWQHAMVANDFYQYEPYNMSEPSQRTEVKVLYDDRAIYIGAIMYDDTPAEIFKEFGRRDNSDFLKADAFSVLISPYNDGINYLEFIVSASGLQTDIRHTGVTSDRSWNAVWESSAAITDEGWVVEIAIPFSALRFSSKTSDNWGINFRRLIKRYNEWSTWNPVDNSIEGVVNQSGDLAGINDVTPPIRFSISPYVSGYIEKHPGNDFTTQRLNGGVDLQLGLSKSFTLDMTLIPDFGQVKSDDKELNITPFEIQYQEERPFFNEGMDLFNKGEIFYSRRIGTLPKGFMVNDTLLSANEKIVGNPLETALINATKISGRTSYGLGVGVLNAITANTFATIRDTLTGAERTILTQGLTNYNMVVFDQTLKHNSFISIANTNLAINNQDYMANVTATDFLLRDRANRFALLGKADMSYISNAKSTVGYRYKLGFNKTSGTIIYGASAKTTSKHFNPNDMGFLMKSNELIAKADVGYRILRPTWKILNLNTSIGAEYTMLENPMVYNESRMYWSFLTTFAKYHHFFMGEVWVNPKETHDYFEPRVPGWKVIKPSHAGFMLNTSSDYRKPLAIDTYTSYSRANEMNMSSLSVSIAPRIRLSNRILITYECKQQFDRNDIGYVGHLPNGPQIFMGLRDVSTLTNTLDGLLSFTANSFLNIRVRHYWRQVEYNSYHSLNANGTLSAPINSPQFQEDINFNLFNIDMMYRWHFAPGSELSVVWKNLIEIFDSNINSTYLTNLEGLWNAQQGNSISLRLLYYLDYNSVFRKRNV